MQRLAAPRLAGNGLASAAPTPTERVHMGVAHDHSCECALFSSIIQHLMKHPTMFDRPLAILTVVLVTKREDLPA